jgi:hypothetical protein
VNEFQATAVMVGLFALRCVLPMALTIGIGYLMNRWVARSETADSPRPAADPTPSSIPVLAVESKLPCWVVRNCDEDRRAACPAGTGLLTCWLARLRVEGALPATCADCELYDSPAPRLAIGD